MSLEREVITRANARIGRRVRTVTCPVHRKTYPVSIHGLAIVVLDEPCCKAGIDSALEDAVEQALR